MEALNKFIVSEIKFHKKSKSKKSIKDSWRNLGRLHRNVWYLRESRNVQWARGAGGMELQAAECGQERSAMWGWAGKQVVGEKILEGLWVMGGQDPNQRATRKETYLQIIFPRDLLWQGLICSEQAIAFHISGWHFLISRTGMLMNGILMLPFSHSFMSFMAPWSDCALQLLKSSVGLKRTKARRDQEANIF